MKTNPTARREFLLQAGSLAGMAWATAQWPTILAAAQHAHKAAKSQGKFEVLTEEEARQVEAIAAQLIPTDELPGAKEAGVVYFIDRALKTFAKDDLATYQKGIADLNQATTEKYPGIKSFADANTEQQIALLTELSEEEMSRGGGRGRFGGQSADFFQTILNHTVMGFLVDPEAGGNRDYVGWKVAGRDPAYSFSPPFGYYDKDYPGWQPAAAETEKK